MPFSNAEKLERKELAVKVYLTFPLKSRMSKVVFFSMIFDDRLMHSDQSF